MLQLIAQAIAIILLLTSTTSLAAVGVVTEQTGPMEIVRQQQHIPSKINTSVEMLDTVTTAKAKAELTFVDKTTVKITEQSKLVIDDFVYDPNKGAGKLSMKVALGTARYASGQIAKSNPQSVNIQTPTATIAVRGTDFSMTVDELGRSLVMLLPSCDKDRRACVTGAILVSTDAGEVYMDIAFQTTVVESKNQPPSKPVIVNIDIANINNMLIVSKPQEIKAEQMANQQNDLDKNFLNVDLLAYTALEQNMLNDNKELDVNALDTDFLKIVSINSLEVENKALLANALDKNLLPGYNEDTGLKYYFNDDQTLVTLHRNTTHNAYITFPTDQNATLILKQDGITIPQNVNKGASSVVTITQQ